MCKKVFNFQIIVSGIAVVPSCFGTTAFVDIDGVKTKCLYNEYGILSFVETDTMTINQISKLEIPFN